MVKKHILVKDFGDYTTLLPALVKHFSKVSYYCDNKSSYPMSANSIVGTGIVGVNRVDNFFDAVDSADIVAFFGNQEADLQEYLRRKGKQVWGSGRGIELENNRFESNEILGDVGLPMVNMEKIIGIKNLRKFLKENENIYVKNDYRGEYESFKSENYELSEPMIDKIEHDLGKNKDSFEFICCHAIDGDDVVESGSDSYFIGGEYPNKIMVGYEVKDSGYVGIVKDRNLVSKIITEPLDKLSPVFKEYDYRGFFSTEIRVGKDKKPYLTDFCCRVGSPCSELYCNMLDNLGEIIDGGSRGVLVEPDYSHKYGVQAIITSSFAEGNWQPIHIDESVKDYVKIKHMAVIDGISYYIPINGIQMSEIGSVVAYDNTLQGAIKKLKEYSSKVNGFKISINVDSIDDGLKCIENGKKLGIYFN